MPQASIKFAELHHESVGDPKLYSEKIGTRLSQQAKALLLRCKNRDNERSYVVITLPAHKRIDFNKVKEVLGGQIKSVRIAEKEKMFDLTGCLPGELPPLGKPWGLPLIMDRDLLKEEEIYFNAASLNYSIITSPHAIKELEEAVLI